MIPISSLTESDKGRWVIYHSARSGTIQRGRLKSWRDPFIFVVYRCDDKWEDYERYTARPTSPEDLKFEGQPITYYG